MTRSSCLSCGAALDPGAERCDLCGTPVAPDASPLDAPVAPLDPIGEPDARTAGRGPGDAAAAPRSAETAPAETPVAPVAADEPPGAAPSALCARCGTPNPPGARYCNRCGASLTAPAEALSDEARPAEPRPAEARPLASPPPAALASESPGARPPSTVGRQALALVGGGLLLVLALYALTVWSGSRTPDATDPEAATRGAPDASQGAAVGPAAPIPDGPTPPLPDSAQAAADRFAAQGTAGGFYESGRYYLTAAFEATGTDPTASAQWARRAVAEFERSLGVQEDPDVRLALAEALRFDPASPPMRPIEEVQRVLQVAPDHPGGTYLLGELRLMRAQFQPEWADSARTSFRRVLELAPPGDPLRARAQEALAQLDAAPAP